MGAPVASWRGMSCIEWLVRMVSGLAPAIKAWRLANPKNSLSQPRGRHLSGPGRSLTGPHCCGVRVVSAEVRARGVASDYRTNASLSRHSPTRRRWWAHLLPLVMIAPLSSACGGFTHEKSEYVRQYRTITVGGGRAAYIPWIEHTPLQQAVENAEPGLVLGLLDFAGADADVNTLSGDCGFPLPCWVHLTARHHQDKAWRLLVAQELIDAGADLKGQAFEHYGGLPPLGSAALFGDLEMMRLLIDAGADVNGRSRSDATILGAAKSYGLSGPHDPDKLARGTAALKMMLDQGADPNLRQRRGDPRFPITYRERRSGVVALGLSVTPLMETANVMTEHHSELVRRARLLVEHGADPSVTNQAGQTALFFAAKNGNVPMLEFLLDAGLDPDHRDGESVTPLGFAARHARTRSVSILLARGADPNAADVHGFTPLMFAALRPGASQDVARALVSAGADPNWCTPDGSAPLMIAAAYGDIDLVRLLLKAGADPHQSHVSGKSAATLALARGHREVYDLLTSSGTGLSPSSVSEKTGR